MNILQIIQLIISLAPTAVQLTQEVVAIIQQIEGVIAKLPTENQAEVANLAVKALVTKATA